LTFKSVQFQRGQYIARGPALPPGSVFSRISTIAFRSVNATSAGPTSTGAERFGRRTVQVEAAINRRIFSSRPCTLAHHQPQPGAAKRPLQAAHQVPVADQAQRRQF